MQTLMSLDQRAEIVVQPVRQVCAPGTAVLCKRHISNMPLSSLRLASALTIFRGVGVEIEQEVLKEKF